MYLPLFFHILFGMLATFWFSSWFSCRATLGHWSEDFLGRCQPSRKRCARHPMWEWNHVFLLGAIKCSGSTIWFKALIYIGIHYEVTKPGATCIICFQKLIVKKRGISNHIFKQNNSLFCTFDSLAGSACGTCSRCAAKAACTFCCFYSIFEWEQWEEIP